MEDPGLVTQIALPLALALIIGSLGLTLTPEDFKRVFVMPRGVAIGMANLLVISPFLGFAVATAPITTATKTISVTFLILGSFAATQSGR